MPEDRGIVFISLKTTLGVSGARQVPNARLQADAVTRITKRLFESPELEAVKSFDGDTRRWLDGVTLPFENGTKMCPVEAIEMVDAELRKRQTARQELVSAFIDAYPRLLREAQDRLTRVSIAGEVYNLWNPKDYDDQTTAERGFNMSYQFISFDAPDVLRSINAQVFDEQRERLAQTIEDAKAAANQLLCETALELVRHLRERLEPQEDGKRKRLHETTLTNLLEFIDTLNFRNLTNNQELAQVAEQLREVVSGTSAERLREGSDYHRKSIFEELTKIEHQIDSDLVPVARRRIAYSEEPEHQEATA